MELSKLLITSVNKNKKNGRYSISLDGRYAFSISEDNYISLDLYEKKEIPDEELNFIKDTILYREAKSVAVRYVNLKIRCEMEMRIKLEIEGFVDSIIERVTDDLKSMGYINDTIYAQKYVYDRNKLKPKAKRLLKYELKSKGIAEKIIDDVLNNFEMDELSVAESLVKRKFGKYDLDDEKIRRKVYSFLSYRGFKPDIIESTLIKAGSDEKIR